MPKIRYYLALHSETGISSKAPFLEKAKKVTINFYVSACSAHNSMRILVAEDEPNILRIYKIFLEYSGHEVISTRDGKECLEQYSLWNQKNLPFDVVVLDYWMPKLDGLSVAKEILLLNPGQTIVMTTAYSLNLVDSQSLSLRKMPILLKPFELDCLEVLIHNSSQMSSSTSSTATFKD